MKRKQRAVFPLAATVLLPQHESPPMYYHVQEAGCLLRKWVGAQRRSTHFVFFFVATVHPCHYKHCISYCGPPASWFAEENKAMSGGNYSQSIIHLYLADTN